MLQVHDVRVRMIDMDYTQVSWKLRVTGEDPLDYDFHILRSGSPAGPYNIIAGPLRADIYDFLDSDVYLQNKLRTYHYRVRVTHRRTGVSEEFPRDSSAYMGAQPTLIALEVQRQERVLFREHVGRRAVLLPRRRFGRRCPRCWDPVTKRRLISQCLTCFDTSWVGGYLQPIEIYIQIDPTPMAVQNTPNSREAQTNTSARLGSFPILHPDDVIVEMEGTRWRVGNISTTERLRAIVRQEPQLHEIVRGSVEYDFPIHWSGSSEASPLREFSNPQSPGVLDFDDVVELGQDLSFPTSGGTTGGGPTNDQSDFMRKAVYDRNRNDIVDRSETLADADDNISTAKEVYDHLRYTKDQIRPARCSVSETVGDIVYVFADQVGGIDQVRKADPLDNTKMPGVGVIVSKASQVDCFVQWSGPTDGIFTGLVPGALYFVGTDGKPSRPPPVPAAAPVFVQSAGVAISTQILYTDLAKVITKRVP